MPPGFRGIHARACARPGALPVCAGPCSPAALPPGYSAGAHLPRQTGVDARPTGSLGCGERNVSLLRVTRDSIMPPPVATFFASLINCLFVGETRIDRPNGGWYRGIIRLTLDGFQVEMRQPEWAAQDAKWRDVRGQWNETTQIRVLDVSAAQAPEAEALVERLAQLLGFATASEVGVAAWEPRAEQPLRPSEGHLRNHKLPSPGDSHEGRRRRPSVRGIHMAWLQPRTRAPQPRRCVPLPCPRGARGHTARAQVGHTIVLEQLKHSYAVSNRYVFLGGFFHTPGTVTPSRRSRQGFQALLGAMFTAVGMNPVLNPVVDLRNEILHSGLSARPFAELMRMEGEILRLVREYLLRLLGYTGEFYTGEVAGVTAVI